MAEQEPEQGLAQEPEQEQGLEQKHGQEQEQELGQNPVRELEQDQGLELEQERMNWLTKWMRGNATDYEWAEMCGDFAVCVIALCLGLSLLWAYLQ